MENLVENISLNNFNESNLKLLSVNEVRKILKIGYKAATKLITDGELHAIRINSRYKIPQLSLDNYIKNISTYKIDNIKKDEKEIEEHMIDNILDDLYQKFSKFN